MSQSGDGDYQDWTPISSHYNPPTGFSTSGSHMVLFARRTEDGWEFGRQKVNEEDIVSIEVL